MSSGGREIDVDRIENADQLRSLMQNARRLGRDDVYWKAFGRLCSLEGTHEFDPLHREFYQTLAAYEELLTQKNGRTTKASRTRQKLANKGIVQALEDWALASHPTDGFSLLMKNGLGHLTGESLVIKYADRFSPQAVSAAKKRIAQYKGS